jgi:hypothetical protein
MPESNIRAVAMVRRIREGHQARLKGLTPSEKITFFRKKAWALHAELGRSECRGYGSPQEVSVGKAGGHDGGK